MKKKILKNTKNNPLLYFFIALSMLEIILLSTPLIIGGAFVIGKTTLIKTGIISCHGIECTQNYNCDISFAPTMSGSNTRSCSWEKYQLYKSEEMAFSGALFLILWVPTLFFPYPEFSSGFYQLLPFINFTVLFLISYIFFRAKHKEKKFLKELKRPINIIVFSSIFLALLGLLLFRISTEKSLDKKARQSHYNTTRYYNSDQKTSISNNEKTKEEEETDNKESKDVIIPENEYGVYSDDDVSFEYPTKIYWESESDEKGYDSCDKKNTKIVRSDGVYFKTAYQNQKPDGETIQVALCNSSLNFEFSGNIVIKFIDEPEYMNYLKDYAEKYQSTKTKQGYTLYTQTKIEEKESWIYDQSSTHYLSNGTTYIKIGVAQTKPEIAGRLINSIVLK